MLVVIPFCHKDSALAVKVIHWAKKLDGHVPFNALLVHDKECNPTDVRTAAEEYFAKVDVFEASVWPGKQKEWPFPQNHQWQETASYIFVKQMREPWFWWEPDATPLKRGWLKAISDEHAKGGKPYTGHIVGEPWGHMTGVGVYPWNVPCYSARAMAAMNTPWDLASKPDMIQHVHRANHLIQHIWERNGQPFTFQGKRDADAVLLSTAVIFHRCKDGSLIDALNGDTFLVRLAKLVGVMRNPESLNIGVMTLGRYGDICNSLPIAKYLADTRGQKVGFVVAKECETILDGCSYVVPVSVDCHYSDIKGALAAVGGQFKELLIPQMYGNESTRRRCDSFLKDAYAHVGFLPRYGNMPLIFDKRNRSREARLINAHIDKTRSNVLVNLSGLSSQFDMADEAMADIKRRWGDFANVIDLAPIKAERIYDLLGLFDSADVLVTTDTSTLHLARASTIPTAALLACKPEYWYGSDVGHVDAKVRYNEWRERREEIHDVIHRSIVRGRGRRGPFYWHVYPDFMGSGDSRRRNELAAQSWRGPYSTGRFRPIPVPDEQLYRMWRLDQGKVLPFLKDVVEVAADRVGDSDWILLSNTDTCFTPDIVARLDKELKGHSCGYSYRRDFKRLDELLTPAQIRTGYKYPGKDIFIFRRSWWEKNRDKMPDMIYGAEGWDALISVLIDESGGKVWDDLIYHERHSSYWETPENRYAVPSQMHCLALAKQFCVEHKIDPAKHGFK